LPMIEDLSALRKEARDMGLTMSGESAASAVKLGDAIENVWKTVKMAGVAIGDALAPTLLEVVSITQKYVSVAVNWVKENKELFVTVLKIGAAIVALGGAIAATGLSLAAAGVILGGFASALALIKVTLLAILSPIGLITVALGAGIVLWAKYTESGQAAVSAIIEGFTFLSDTAKSTWGGISDALASGDLALAGQIAMAGLQVVWYAGIAKLNEAWENWKAFFLTVGNEASSNIASAFVNAWYDIQSVWVEAKGFFLDMFDTIGTAAGNAFRSAQEFLGNGLLDTLEATGVLSAEEAKLAREDLSGRTSGASNNASAGRDARILEREQARKDALAGLDSGRANELASIEQGRGARNAEIEANRMADINAANGRGENAKSKLDVLRQQAQYAREAVEEARKGLTTSAAPAIPDVAARAGKVSGSFSAAALLASGGGNAADRTAKATEIIAKEAPVQSKRMAKIETLLDDGGRMRA